MAFASELVGWLRSDKAGGFLHHDVAPHKFEGMGVGMAASAGLDAGTLIINVPKSACISGVSAHCEEVAAIAAKCTPVLDLVFEKETDWWRLIITVLVEQAKYEKGEASYWGEMLRTVGAGGASPDASSYQCCYLWDEATMAAVDACPDMLKEPCMSMASKLHTEWKAVSRVLAKFDKKFESLTLAQYQHAKCFVATRGIDYSVGKKTVGGQGPTASLCVPVFDLLNHTHEANVRFDVDDVSKVVKVITLRKIEAGEQLFLAYHPTATNFYLLHRYGFFLDGNPHDVLDFLGMTEADHEAAQEAMDAEPYLEGSSEGLFGLKRVKAASTRLKRQLSKAASMVPLGPGRSKEATEVSEMLVSLLRSHVRKLDVMEDELALATHSQSLAIRAIVAGLAIAASPAAPAAERSEAGSAFPAEVSTVAIEFT